VLEPPYLLFYKCSDNTDHPDSEKPEVLLSGFGIEDTHAIANSLRWGPDGWIYGAQGSTVSAAIIHHGIDGKPMAGEKPVRIMGQMIWRYHPETRRFEIFAEGGGNAFGIEIDSKGRIYSGHNGGNTRGFHYIQGGYFQKGFDKHGALSNPYTFGYIRQMDHEKVERFTHAFTIYEGDAFPPEYVGRLFAIAPHMHYVVASEITPAGSTFRTRDIGKVITAGKQPRDDWFTPVDIQLGPDGALYIADWYAAQANHYRSSEGKTNPDLGHVYRLAGKDAKPALVFDLGKLSSEELVKQYLGHPNRWYRKQVLRLLGDRKDRSLIPMLTRMVRENTGQLALEAFWALNLSGGFNDAMALEALDHREPHVRRWAVRLIGDGNSGSTELAGKLAAMAKMELDVEVRSQLACTAKRLPTEQALPIIAALFFHDEDAADLHIPRMLWWALEAHAVDRAADLTAMKNRVYWTSPLHPEGRTLTENLMQRWAMAGSQEDLTACAKLLNLSPDANHTTRLTTAFERAFEGRPIPPLPDVLAEALGRTGGRFAMLLGVRQRDDRAIDAALVIATDSKAKPIDRLQFIRALGDVQAKPDKTVPLLLDLVRSAGDDSLRIGALAAMQKFDAPEAGADVVSAFNALPKSVQPAALSFLASRDEWALALMRAVDSGTIKGRLVPEDVIDRLRSHELPQVARLVALHFPDTRGSKAELEQKIARFKSTLSAGGGTPLAGKELFYGKVACASCHTVFDKGGHIGPDLTSYDRRNLDNMLLAIVNPSAEIREGFEDYIITTKDGRTLDGFKVEEDGKVFILRGTDGQNNVIPVEQIKTRRVSPKSLMPEGLLDGLTEEELRDLFAFLASTTPPK
jgi:putative membrane-bound dehydrogenase-like protein